MRYLLLFSLLLFSCVDKKESELNSCYMRLNRCVELSKELVDYCSLCATDLSRVRYLPRNNQKRYGIGPIKKKKRR